MTDEIIDVTPTESAIYKDADALVKDIIRVIEGKEIGLILASLFTVINEIGCNGDDAEVMSRELTRNCNILLDNVRKHIG